MKRKGLFIRAIFLIVCSSAMTVGAQAQDDERPATREITSLDFNRKRAKGVSGSLQGAPNSETKSQSGKSTGNSQKNKSIINPNRRYKLVKRTSRKNFSSQAAKPKNPDAGQKTGKQAEKIEELGVTFWRLRPRAEDESDAETFPVKIEGKQERWTAERVASTTKFRVGDRVRFTIEASRSGFLYIVNREFYTDGGSGKANIIFPTLRTRGGDNRVTAGSLIEIPASTDSVPFFTVKPSGENYAGEELLVVISPVKLPVETGLRPQAVSPEMVQKWLDDWGATVDIYDAEDGEGVAYTQIEAKAATSASRSLIQEEPLPQTIFRVKVSPDAPIIVPFQMQADIP